MNDGQAIGPDSNRTGRNWVKISIIIGLVICLYVGAYAVLSSMGKYGMTMSGKRRMLGSMAIMDCYKWQPPYMEFEVIVGSSGDRRVRRADFLGYVFSPLILLDRMFVHKTKGVTEL